MTARPLALLLLAGCAGLPVPTPREAADIAHRLDWDLASRAPFSRIVAEVDVEGPTFGGSFQAILLLRGGADPAVRLQLLPDVGGKVLDLVARRDRITGYFPKTGEGVDVALPGEARAHPIVFIGVTLLERFAGAEGRVTGAERRDGAWSFTLRSVTGTVDVSGTVGDDPGMSYLGLRRELRFRWSAFVSWAWRDPSEEVLAPGFRLRVKSARHEPVESVHDALFRLELPVDGR